MQDVIQKRPNAKTTILKLQKQLTTFLSQKKAVDDAIKEKSKKRPIGVGTNGPEKKNKKNIPSGKKVSFDDDIVEVYDDKGRKVYSGMLDDCPYKYENYKWNESDKNYDLPKGYKMVGK